MNLILLTEADFISPTRVRLTGRRLAHIRDILKAERSQALSVGKINGLMGQGTLVAVSDDAVEMEVDLNTSPPQALPLTVILALPRPPMFKRILFSAAMLGVQKIIVLNFNRVEKSLWNSSSLKAEAMEEQLILGLEQSKDTLLPQIILKKAFKPFVEDELPGLIKGKVALAAHPGNQLPDMALIDRIKQGAELVLVIGPEGGIIDYEIQALRSAGCHPIGLGQRILRTDSVLPYIIGKFF